jgi:hypothetical protein
VAEVPLYADTGSAHHSIHNRRGISISSLIFSPNYLPFSPLRNFFQTNCRHLQSRSFPYRRQSPSVVRLLKVNIALLIIIYIMKMLIKLALSLLVMFTATAGPVFGQILRLGHCPSFSVLKDFEMDKVQYINKIFDETEWELLTKFYNNICFPST